MTDNNDNWHPFTEEMPRYVISYAKSNHLSYSDAARDLREAAIIKAAALAGVIDYSADREPLIREQLAKLDRGDGFLLRGIGSHFIIKALYKR
jgi:hypothetical protein